MTQRQRNIEKTREKKGLAEVVGQFQLTNEELDDATRRQAIDDDWDTVKPKVWKRNKFSSERKKLYDILASGETIEHLAGGLLKGGDKKWIVPHDAVAVATSNRLILFDEGLFGNIEVQYLPYRNIEAVRYRTGNMSSVEVSVRGGVGFKLDDVNDKDSVRAFADGVSAHVEADQRPSPSPVPPEPAPSSTSALDDLERLASLLERGHLTQEEFDAQKAQLLGR